MNTVQLPTIFQQVIHKSRYARWNDEHGRREHWTETVERYLNFMQNHLRNKYDHDIGSLSNRESCYSRAHRAITHLDAMPSMRCLMSAGPALEREHLCGFNCNYVAVNHVRAFDEAMYLLMCGCGVGFSVERQYIGHLPIVPRRLKPSDEVIVVEDSRDGWADAYRTLIDRLYAGNIPQWNVSKVRPAGARLKTMGGYASGPGPLVDLFKFTVEVFKTASADNRRLESVECHDLMCKIGDIVVMGGVRRSALISLSNPSDLRMQQAKFGNWHTYAPYRQLSNNSACYTERPSVGTFMNEWASLYHSKSGERGIVNRRALKAKCLEIGRRVQWDDFAGAEAEDDIDFGCNPCAEIILRNMETCNLSEVIARPTDQQSTLAQKASLATMLGTWQATLSDYGYVRPDWNKNAQEERLLGVSCTGIMDTPVIANRHTPEFANAWSEMRQSVRETNHAWAEVLGIHKSAAMTCVKPSGTVSQLVNSSSGIHTRYSPFYIRRITMLNTDPMTEFLRDMGVPNEPKEGDDRNTMFAFPIRSPKGANVVDSNRPAIEQLEQWLAVNKAWADHSVSCTVEVEEKEWPLVQGWVWQHFDEISGVSFLPKWGRGSVYRQMPYEPVEEAELAKLEAQMPDSIDWDLMGQYERDDTTVAGKELACAGGACELVGAGG